jgi:hypothetical protein
MKISGFTILGILLLLTVLTVGTVSANINTFDINVVDSNFNPLQGASVSLTVPGYGTYTQTTNSLGNPSPAFSGYNIASPTTASLLVSKSGYNAVSLSSATWTENPSIPGHSYAANILLTTASQSTTDIEFHVMDSNGNSISGAVLTISQGTLIPGTGSSTTGILGYTGVYEVPAGTSISYSISASGYNVYSVPSASFTYNANTIPVNIYMTGSTPTTTDIEFRVLDYQSNNPISGATISCPAGSLVAGTGSATTSSSGYSGVYTVPTGTSVSYSASASGYTTASNFQAFAYSYYTLPVVIYLVPSSPTTTIIQAYVADNSGNPLPNAVISISQGTLIPGTGSATTNAYGFTGRYNIPVSTPLTITINAAGYYTNTTTQSFTYSTSPQLLEVSMNPVSVSTTVVQFHILDSTTSSAISGASVSLTQGTLIGGTGTGTTNTSGYTGMYNVPVSAALNVTITASGYYTKESSQLFMYSLTPQIETIYSVPTNPQAVQIEYPYGTTTWLNTYDYSPHTGNKLFDHDLSVNGAWWMSSNSDPFISSTSSGVWAKMDYGNGVSYTITHYSIYPGYYTPVTWHLYGSNDDSTWTSLDYKTGQSLTNNVWANYTFSNGVAYRYYLIGINQSSDVTGYQMEVNEWDLLGDYIAPTPTPTPTPGATGNLSTLLLKVTDTNGTALSGALVSVTAPGYTTHTQTTDATGTPNPIFNGYSLPTPQSNIYITASKSGYLTNSTSYTFTEDTSTPGISYLVTIRLSSSSTTQVYVTTLDTLTNAPIQGANVFVALGNPANSTTASYGSSPIISVPVSTPFSIITSANSYYTDTSTFTVSPSGSPQELTIYLLRPSTTPAPTYTIAATNTQGQVPTVPPITPGVNGTYTGFWGAGFNMFAAMGASPGELGILMAAIFVVMGFIIGGAGAGTINPGAPFSVGGAEAGAAVGFILSCAFGFIGLVWVIVLILIGVFVMIFFR